MSKLFGLTGRTADALTRKLGEPVNIGGKLRSLPAARGVAWVKVTGVAAGGWHPGVVSLDTDGTFTDLSAAVQIKPVDGGTLANGARYLATRTKNASDGKARFRALPWTYFAEDTPSADYTFPDSNFNDVTGCSITVPEAGRYLVGALWVVTGRATTVGCGPIYGRIRVNTTDYASVPLLHPHAVTAFDLVGGGYYSKLLNLAASDVVKMQAARLTPGGAWAAGAFLSGNSHLQISRV